MARGVGCSTGVGAGEPAVAPDRGGITVIQSSTSHQPPRQVNGVVRFLNVGSQPMDDETFLRILRAEPDNDEVRLAYWNWLEETTDDRAPYVRLMRQRLRLLEQLEETDGLIRTQQPRDEAWINIAFPMRVRSPMVGRCYIKPMPDAAPFVEVGSQVTPETVVCLIEAVKLFNEITAGFHGVVSEVAVTNGAPVEYNQVLFRVSRPSLDFW